MGSVVIMGMDMIATENSDVLVVCVQWCAIVYKNIPSCTYLYKKHKGVIMTLCTNLVTAPYMHSVHSMRRCPSYLCFEGIKHCLCFGGGAKHVGEFYCLPPGCDSGGGVVVVVWWWWCHRCVGVWYVLVCNL